MLVVCWAESSFLGFCSFGLIACAPDVIGHAINIFTSLVLANLISMCGTSFLNPSQQTISAKSKIHHIDILHICAGLQMVTKSPKDRCLKLCFYLRSIFFRLLICLSPLSFCYSSVSSMFITCRPVHLVISFLHAETSVLQISKNFAAANILIYI